MVLLARFKRTEKENMKSAYKTVIVMGYGAYSGKHKSGKVMRRTAKKVARRLDDRNSN